MANNPESLCIDDQKYIREDLATSVSFDVQEPIGIAAQHVGRYCIVRSRSEGINAGYVLAADETGVLLKDARRMWYHRPKKGAWYEGVAVHGPDSDCKVSEPTLKCIVESYSLTLCSDDVAKQIQELPNYEG